MYIFTDFKSKYTSAMSIFWQSRAAIQTCSYTVHTENNRNIHYISDLKKKILLLWVYDITHVNTEIFKDTY